MPEVFVGFVILSECLLGGVEHVEEAIVITIVLGQLAHGLGAWGQSTRREQEQCLTRG